MHKLILLLFLLIISCTTSEENETNNPISVDKISEIKLYDISDFGNGKDFKIEFKKVSDETKIDHYKVFILNSSDSINIDSIETIENYTIVEKTGENLSTTLNEASKTSKGDLIRNGAEYKVQILSVADKINAQISILSDRSEAITLHTVAPKAGQPSIQDLENNFNASDIHVTFSRTSPEETITEYRIFILESDESTTAAELTSLGTNTYHSILTQERPISESVSLNFLENQKTITGNSIQNDKSYKVTVLSISNGTNTTVNSMSEYSNTITLLKFAAKISIELSDTDNTNSVTDFEISASVNSVSNLATINSYRFYLVTEGTDFTIDILNNGLYTALNLSESKSLSTDKTIYNLTADSKDFQNNTITNQKSYVLFAESFAKGGNENNLSEPSEAIQLSFTPEVTTLLENSPSNDDLEIGPDGFLYGSDVLNGGNQLNGTKIYKFNVNDGSYTEYADGLKVPIGNAFDSNGNLFVSNFNSSSISKIATDGTVSTHISGYSSPSGLVIDSSNNIYFASYNGNTIRKISHDGVVTTIASGNNLNGPVGITLDDNENLYVANYNDGKIFKIENGSTSLAEIAQISGPSNLVIGHMTYTENHLYATGIGTHKIYQISLNGDIKVIAGSSAGSSDGIGAKAKFTQPNGIEASDDGKFLYISEFSGKKSIRIIQLKE